METPAQSPGRSGRSQSSRTPRSAGGPTPREEKGFCGAGDVHKGLIRSATFGAEYTSQKLDLLVDHRQFEDWPAGTLLCARALKATLIGLVFACTFTMVYEYFFGSFGVETEIIKITSFEMPQMVVCPVWGEGHFTTKVNTVLKGNNAIAPYGSSGWKKTPFSAAPCHHFAFEYVALHSERVKLEKIHNDDIDELGCHCLDFSGTDMSEERIGKQGLLMEFEFMDPKNESRHLGFDSGVPVVSIGFSDAGLYPGEWSYVEVGKRNVGELLLETRVYGKTPVTDGQSINRYSFNDKVAFAIPHDDSPSKTQIIMTPATFFVQEIADVASIWSMFALVSLLVLVMANCNSIQLFDFCFAEKVDAHDPDQMEPNWFLMKCCGCFPCCHKLEKHSTDEEEGLLAAERGDL